LQETNGNCATTLSILETSGSAAYVLY